MRLVSFTILTDIGNPLYLPEYNLSSKIIDFSFRVGTANVSNGFVVDTLSGAAHNKPVFTHNGVYKFSNEANLAARVNRIEALKGQAGLLSRATESYRVKGTYSNTASIGVVFTSGQAVMTIQHRARRPDLYVLSCSFSFEATEADWS